MIKLYRKNAVGIGTWCIWPGVVINDECTIYFTHAITDGAAEVAHTELVTRNNSGRSIEDQVALQINSRVSRQRDKGYKDTLEEAKLGSTNQMNLVNPMLAQSLDKVKNIQISSEWPAYVQPKLDGHRCLITNVDGEILAYTRKGKPITTVSHILQNLKWLPEGKTLDGELYIHGRALQSISSLIKRQQPDSQLLRYHWYDYVSTQWFGHRTGQMAKIVERYSMPNVHLVETFKVTSMEQVYNLFKHFRNLKYEGAMLRLDQEGYEDGKRASQLLKVKEREDCEVTVLGASPSKDGWAILKVQMDNGKIFDISAPGTVHEKTYVMNNIATHVARRLTIEYAMLTADGIPFHAVAMRWRDDL